MKPKKVKLAKTLVYNDAIERGKQYESLFKDILDFDKVEICKDLSKADIISKLAAVKAEAEDFEKTNQDQSVFAVSIVWVGYKLSYNVQHHLEIFK